MKQCKNKNGESWSGGEKKVVTGARCLVNNELGQIINRGTHTSNLPTCHFTFNLHELTAY